MPAEQKDQEQEPESQGAGQAPDNEDPQPANTSPPLNPVPAPGEQGDESAERGLGLGRWESQ